MSRDDIRFAVGCQALIAGYGEFVAGIREGKADRVEVADGLPGRVSRFREQPGRSLAGLRGMEEKLYPNLATFLVRLASLAMLIYGLGVVLYWWLVVPQISGDVIGLSMAGAAGLWTFALSAGGFWIVGAIALFALSRPLGKLVALGL